MASAAYLNNRKRYQRPQAVLFADNPGVLVEYPADSGLYRYVPEGFEVGASTTSTDLLNEFVILSDDNREPIEFSTTRIERRERMINGRMRSYHIADKLAISLNWKMLPSRAYADNPEFSTSSDPALAGKSYMYKNKDLEYTSDGGAGGVEILDWYKNHKGSFWVYLAYDNYKNFENDEDQYSKLAQYTEVIEVFFADFNYTVNKRGGSNYDFWDISLTLEEV